MLLLTDVPYYVTSRLFWNFNICWIWSFLRKTPNQFKLIWKKKSYVYLEMSNPSHKTFGFVLRHCEYSQFQCWMLSVVERYLIKIEWSNNPCGNISTYAVSRKRIIVCFTRLDSCFRAHHSMKFIMVGHKEKIFSVFALWNTISNVVGSGKVPPVSSNDTSACHAPWRRELLNI